MKRLLIIAGSDCSGGAGVQADLKTSCAFGVYGMTAITAITVQNTLGVTGVQRVDPDTVYDQIAACLADIGADAIKTGMLVDAAIVDAVANALRDHAKGIPLVLDPVMVATSGDALIDDAAVETVVKKLFPLATVVTPNLPEARRLTGIDGEAAGRRLIEMGARAALVKGGHKTVSGRVEAGFPSETAREQNGAENGMLEDVLLWLGGTLRLSHPRIDTSSTHGTGCTLASAIACGLALGDDLPTAVAKAHDYVQAAIRSAPGFGRGHGPLNHMCPVPGAMGDS